QGNENGGYSSPACSLAEVEDAYAGYMTRAEVLALLNELTGRAELAPEDRAVLAGHIRALGGDPGGAGSTGAPDGPHLEERIRSALPKIRDDRLHADLRRMAEAGE